MDERGAYRLGGWLWELGTLAASRMTLREIALPYMQDLYEATHENVQLAVLEGFDALFVERIRGPRSVSIVSRPGGRLPLHATGVGKVLLAYAPPEYVEEVIARGLAQMTPYTITDGNALRRCLAEVRERGYSATRDEMTVGAVSVGAAIFGPDDQVVGAVSLVVASRGADPKALAPTVRAVASGLTRRVVELWDSGRRLPLVREHRSRPSQSGQWTLGLSRPPRPRTV